MEGGRLVDYLNRRVTWTKVSDIKVHNKDLIYSLCFFLFFLFNQIKNFDSYYRYFQLYKYLFCYIKIFKHLNGESATNKGIDIGRGTLQS